MDITVFAVFIVVFLIGLYIFNSGKRLPPGPASIPFFGSVFLLNQFSKRKSHLVLFDEAKKHGDIMSFQIGNQFVVVLSGYDAVYDALVQNADFFSDRANHLPVMRALMEDGNGILLNDYNPEWRALRRLFLRTLRELGVGKNSLEESILSEVDHVSSKLEHVSADPVDVVWYVEKLIGNIAFGITFGTRYDIEDPEFLNIIQTIQVVFQGAGYLSPSAFYPKIIAELLFSKDAENEKRRIESNRKMKDYVVQQIESHRASFDPDNIRDFIDFYIEATEVKLEDGNEHLTAKNIFRMIMDLFLAGIETTTSTFSWVFLYMVQYPDVQKKCQQEIQKVVGDKVVRWTDRKNLPYIEATLMEAQRIANILPLSVSHCNNRDASLGGYDIPERTMLIPNMYSVAMDTKYWDEPEKFKPERFIGKSGELLKNEAYIPFSVGPRVCPGELLAKMQLFLIFTNLLQRFDFLTELDGASIDVGLKENSITNVAKPYKLRLHRRA